MVLRAVMSLSLVSACGSPCADEAAGAVPNVEPFWDPNFELESGVPAMQLVIPVDLGVSHAIDWHEEARDNGDSACVWIDAPLMGAQIQVQPAGGDPITLVEGATDYMFTHYTGTTYYAASYAVTVDDHGTIYTTGSFSFAPLFTVTASASVDTLFINWSPCDSPTNTPCVGGIDNPNDITVRLSVFDAGGVMLFDTFVADRGVMGFRITGAPDIVSNAARVSVHRGLKMFTTVVR